MLLAKTINELTIHLQAETFYNFSERRYIKSIWITSNDIVSNFRIELFFLQINLGKRITRLAFFNQGLDISHGFQ